MSMKFSGISRWQITSGRRSLSVTIAARDSRLLPEPLAMAPRLVELHGTTRHAVVQEAAARDDRPDVFVWMLDQPRRVHVGPRRLGEVWAEIIELDAPDARLVEEQALAVLADDGVHLVPAEQELLEHADGVGRAAGAADADHVTPSAGGDGLWWGGLPRDHREARVLAAAVRHGKLQGPNARGRAGPSRGKG